MENQIITTIKQSSQAAWDPQALVTPTLPAEFTSAILIDYGVECVWSWLKENAPQDIQNVFQGMLWGFDVKCQAAANGGRIPAHLDDSKLDWFIGAVQSMSALGFEFS